MGEQGAYGERMAAHFGVEAPAPLVVKSLKKVSFAATRLTSHKRDHGLTNPITPEETLSFSLKLRDMGRCEFFMGGKAIDLPAMPIGTFSVVDLMSDPIANLTDPFDLLFFYLPRASFDAMADDLAVRRIDDLNFRMADCYDDPVIRHLGLSLMPALDRTHEVNQLFVDHVASALQLHIARTYGGMGAPPQADNGLAPWQLRRATELLSARLDGNIEIAEVAAACSLSLSHFARAFKRSTGLPPHRWLLARRVDLAKSMLRSSDAPLADVARLCGFVDQSHLTRVFRKATGASPGAWRRERRS